MVRHNRATMSDSQTMSLCCVYIIRAIENVVKPLGLDPVCAQTIRTLLAKAREFLMLERTKRLAGISTASTKRLASDYITRVVVMTVASMRMVDVLHLDHLETYRLIEDGLQSEFCQLALTATFRNVCDNYAWVMNAVAVAEVLSNASKMSVPDDNGANMPVCLLCVPVALREHIRNHVLKLSAEALVNVQKNQPGIRYLVEHGSACTLAPGIAPELRTVSFSSFDSGDFKLTGFSTTTERAVWLYYTYIDVFATRVATSKLMPSADQAKALVGPVEIKTEAPITIMSRSSPCGFVPVDGQESSSMTVWDTAGSAMSLSIALDTIVTTKGLDTKILSPRLFHHLLFVSLESLENANKLYGQCGVLCLVFRLLVYASLHESVMSFVQHNTDDMVSPKPLEAWKFECVAASDPNWSPELCTGVSSDKDTSLTPAANYLSAALNQLLNPGTRWWMTKNSSEIFDEDQGNPRVPVMWLIPRTIEPAFSGADAFCRDSSSGRSSVVGLEETFLKHEEARTLEDDMLRSIMMERAEPPISAGLAAIQQVASEVLVLSDASKIRNVILTVWGTVCIPLAQQSLKVMYDWSAETESVDALLHTIKTCCFMPMDSPSVVIKLE